MTNLLLILLILFLSPCARANAAGALSFAAQVNDEGLAEEAILLAHCLATRTGEGWEFDGEAHGTHWLKVKEADHQLKGSYGKDGKETAFSLAAGESESTCEKLEPALAAAAPENRLAPLAPARTLDPLAETSEENPLEAGPRKTWLWVGVGLAAVAGGVLLWRAHQPSYRALQME
ncbi:MAG: hypothetical protein ACXWP1_10345 [Bdellovibrionota bacterium]